MAKQGTTVGKVIVKKKKNVGGASVPDFRTHQGMEIKTMWYWWKDRHMEPTEHNPEPRKRFTQLCKLIIDRGAKAIQWGERAAFPHMVPEQLGIHRPEKTNKQSQPKYHTL